MLSILLRRRGFDVTPAAGVKDACGQLRETEFDAVVSDLVMPDGSGLEVLTASREASETTQVILMTAFATTEQAVEAMRQGAYDFLEKPFKNDVLVATLEKALEKHDIVEENRALREQVQGSGTLIGVSRAMVKLRSLIDRAANAKTSVLITGQSGTGKEVVARALHDQSARSSAAFVVVNCGALPEALMESELFGHEKGAFTGAAAHKDGLFRAASGGTLFLDEVGELPTNLQVKLLRVLQEKKVRPVGATNEVPVDVRLVAATNRDLEAEVASGTFREDLFYRLNVIRLHLPALRDRPEDILPLADHLLERHCALQQRRLSLSETAQRWLARQPFPGNVRELENRLERAVALAAGPAIELFDLGAGSTTPPPLTLDDGFDLEAHLAEVERDAVERALAKAGGNRTKAAKILGVSFRSLRYRLAKYGMGDD